MRLRGIGGGKGRKAGLERAGTGKHLFLDPPSSHHVGFQKLIHFLLILFRREGQVLSGRQDTCASLVQASGARPFKVRLAPVCLCVNTGKR